MLILHTATMLNSSIIFDNLLVNSLGFLYMISWASTSYHLVTQMVKNLPAMKETWVWPLACLGRSLGEGNDYPLQYSCLKNSMTRGAWWATSSHLCIEIVSLTTFQFVNDFLLIASFTCLKFPVHCWIEITRWTSLFSLWYGGAGGMERSIFLHLIYC